MINEISQNMLSVMPAQPKGESGKTSRVQASQAAAAPVAQEPKRLMVKGAEETKAGSVEKNQLEKIVDDLNGFAQAVQRQLQFSVDEDNGKVVITVVDAETKDVIREIPSEEIRNMQKQLGEVSDRFFQKGESTSLLFQGEA